MSVEDRRIRLVISTNAGDLDEEFSVNQPLAAIKRQAMARLKLDPSQAEEFALVLDGQVLDEASTLNDLGIESGTVLTLERREVVKI